MGEPGRIGFPRPNSGPAGPHRPEGDTVLSEEEFDKVMQTLWYII